MSESTPAPHAARLLVVDDEAPIRKFLRAGLADGGYTLEEAENGKDAITLAATRPPDLILLDLGLPDMDGVEVVRRVREWSTLPIVVVSARGQEADKIRALDAGADDYVTKPFAMGELLARIRAAMRRRDRADVGESSVLELGDLGLDLGRRIVTVAGAEVKLTPIEYRLLALLARHAGRVITHDQLLREVWGPRHGMQHHLVRVHMASLRHKIEADPARPRRIVTELGVGYRLRDD